MKKIYKLKIFVSIILLGIIFFISVIIKREKNIDEKISKNIKETVEKTSTSPKEEQISTNQAQIVEKEQINSEYKGYKTSAKLYIPKINLETYVIENYSKEALLTSVTKFYGGKANEVGNFCIAGHNYGNENMFQNIKKLEINDELYLVDKQGNKMKYIIYDTYTVYPNETECLSQKTNGKIELTLITCTFDSEKRIIIKAIADSK